MNKPEFTDTENRLVVARGESGENGENGDVCMSSC